MRIQITDQFVKRAVHWRRGSPIHMDVDVMGFGIQLRASSRKTFTLDYSFEALRRRLLIGDYPEWSVVAAREEAKRFKREIDRGVDPLAIREERFTAPTVAELLERYLADHVACQRTSSAADITRRCTNDSNPTYAFVASRLAVFGTQLGIIRLGSSALVDIHERASQTRDLSGL